MSVEGWAGPHLRTRRHPQVIARDAISCVFVAFTPQESMDSLFRSFDSHFDLGKTSFFGRDLFSRDLDSLFFNDSLRYPDFFHDDFFLKRYELNDSYLRNMMRRMDSLKNDFFREHSQRGRGDESHDL